MTIPKFFKSARVQLWIGAIFLSIDLVIVGFKFDLSKSDWGTWVGSVGTVGTLIGTVWIATSERRKRESEALDLATVSAADILFKLMEVRKGLQVCIEGLAVIDANPWHAMRNCANVISGVTMWTTPELAAIALLPKRVAATLAICGADIDWCKRILSRNADLPLNHPHGDFITTARMVSSRFTSIMATLDRNQEEITMFLVRTGFNGWTGDA